MDDYLPNSTKVAAKMMHELAVKLKEKGHVITVITPGIGLDEHYRKKKFRRNFYFTIFYRVELKMSLK